MKLENLRFITNSVIDRFFPEYEGPRSIEELNVDDNTRRLRQIISDVCLEPRKRENEEVRWTLNARDIYVPDETSYSVMAVHTSEDVIKSLKGEFGVVENFELSGLNVDLLLKKNGPMNYNNRGTPMGIDLENAGVPVIKVGGYEQIVVGNLVDFYKFDIKFNSFIFEGLATSIVAKHASEFVGEKLEHKTELMSPKYRGEGCTYYGDRMGSVGKSLVGVRAIEDKTYMVFSPGRAIDFEGFYKHMKEGIK